MSEVNVSYWLSKRVSESTVFEMVQIKVNGKIGTGYKDEQGHLVGLEGRAVPLVLFGDAAYQTSETKMGAPYREFPAHVAGGFCYTQIYGKLE
ncbi:hypothetical protein TUMSATVNIG1_61010 (plasmid) [Vibrio nigripulchritudo]|uniref:hypothetical protein n=1 Tax=Vibrio nigripulchritudo TaxID=28173 RepID=UPI00190C9678|nr:hypothetical protein [Vibrio nigripulchritudo]BCL74117.1 hypothetical protein VNTUMSATTG_60540 [Vibrio nigripulchritudo]BDU35492.1 hypothetical protein TUMSATVNIG1_61010 [Vibrio nigripulchritudo]